MKKLIEFIFLLIATFSIITPIIVFAEEKADVRVPDIENTSSVTKISLENSKISLYVAKKYQIKPLLTNANGKTTYKSNNKSVATVDDNGKVRALKKGAAIITVTNNNASTELTVNVKEPTLNAKSKTIVKNKSFTIKIKGKSGKATFKSSNSKIAKVNKSGKITALKKGKTTITVKTNVNVKLKCKVTVKNPSKWDLVKYEVTFKRLIESLTVNLGEPKRFIGDYFETGFTDNVFTLYQKNKISYTQFQKYEKKLDKINKKVTFSIADSSIGELSKTKSDLQNTYSDGISVIPKKQGTTNILIKYGKKTLKIKYAVIKKDEFTFKKKKAKAVYTVDEASKLLNEEYYDRLAEGKEKKYDYLFFYMSPKKVDEAIEKATNTAKSKDKYLLGYVDYDSPLNCWDYSFYDVVENRLLNNDYSENKIDCFYTSDDIEECTERITERKAVYLETNKIFEEYKVNEYENDYEKILALGKWFDEKIQYGNDTVSKYSGDAVVIVEHKGVCGNYAQATKYFCYRLNIPCYHISSSYKDSNLNHGWNVVKIQGKWYHLDILWHLYFLGSETIKTKNSHTNFSFVNLYSSDTVKGQITIEKEDFIIPDSKEGEDNG